MKEDNYYLIKQYFDNLINYAKMKEESKFYTPEHEDMLIGLEYQIFQGKPVNPAESGWKVLVFDGGHFGLEKAIKAGLVIVKRLDREDIESLEFAFLPNPNVDWIDVYSIKSNNSEYSLTQTKSSRILIDKHLESGNMAKLFNGTVNNKSELQRVLKMVGI